MSRNAMRCPVCRSEQVRVYSSDLPVRYRRCIACGHNFRTQELHQETCDLLIAVARAIEQMPDESGIRRRAKYIIDKLFLEPERQME